MVQGSDNEVSALSHTGGVSTVTLREPSLEVLRLQREARSRSGRTEDHVGAVRSFLAKETPRFRGR